MFTINILREKGDPIEEKESIEISYRPFPRYFQGELGHLVAMHVIISHMNSVSARDPEGDDVRCYTEGEMVVKRGVSSHMVERDRPIQVPDLEAFWDVMGPQMRFTFCGFLSEGLDHYCSEPLPIANLPAATVFDSDWMWQNRVDQGLVTDLLAVLTRLRDGAVAQQRQSRMGGPNG